MNTIALKNCLRFNRITNKNETNNTKRVPFMQVYLDRGDRLTIPVKIPNKI